MDLDTGDHFACEQGVGETDVVIGQQVRVDVEAARESGVRRHEAFETDLLQRYGLVERGGVVHACRDVSAW